MAPYIADISQNSQFRNESRFARSFINVNETGSAHEKGKDTCLRNPMLPDMESRSLQMPRAVALSGTGQAHCQNLLETSEAA